MQSLFLSNLIVLICFCLVLFMFLIWPTLIKFIYFILLLLLIKLSLFYLWSDLTPANIIAYVNGVE